MEEKKIVIKEVGPRDGLQNEKEILSSKQKIDWINQLSNTGIPYIEITSFVPSSWIPQLADALEVAQGITRLDGVTYAALVPNQKGLESALEANIDEVSLFMSASESHNKKNINKTITETFPIMKAVAKESLQSGKRVRAYVSTAFGCPYEGAVSIDSVLKICDRLLTDGAYEISLGDTIGVANPVQVEIVLTEVLKRFSVDEIALHFHNTRGMALANILRGIDMGIKTFDSSLGGLGGCPYAPGASGNVATDDLVHMLGQMGYETGINEEKLMDAAVFIQNILRKSLKSHQMSVMNQAK